MTERNTPPARHQSWELAQMQALPLTQKISMTKRRIREWYDAFEGQVYVSFSGGKDSTVLLHIVRSMYPDVPATFCDTGLEYPEIREFVKTFENVEWLKPKMNFKEVIRTCGYPVISKEVSQVIREARVGLQKGDGTYQYRLDQLNGERRNADGSVSKYNKAKYKYLLDAPYLISEECCKIMKKDPAKRYEKVSGRKAIIGTMAAESMLRKQRWMRYGCNAYEDHKRPISTPLAFWTEQDVLEYLVRYAVPFCSVYGDIIGVLADGSMLTDDELRPMSQTCGIPEDAKLRTTGAQRTGCMFCCLGLSQDPERFLRMKETHPTQYAWCMKPVEEGGLGLDEVLNFIHVPH